jgi:hypothetical protein
MPTVVQYDFGKTVGEGRFQRIGTLNQPPPSLLTATSQVEASYMQGNDCRIMEVIGKALSVNPSMEA